MGDRDDPKLPTAKKLTIFPLIEPVSWVPPCSTHYIPILSRGVENARKIRLLSRI